MAAFTVLCVSACLLIVSGQLLTTDLTQSLLELVTEERTLRAQLESDTADLEKELESLKVLQQNASCGCPMNAAPIAFSTTLTKDYTTFGRLQPVVFDKVDLNVGNAYDARHGTFVAPVDGAYYFTFAMLSDAGRTVGVELVMNQDALVRTRSGDNSFDTMGTNNVVLELRAGDEVFIRHQNLSDSNRLNGENYTSFSGYLIEG